MQVEHVVPILDVTDVEVGFAWFAPALRISRASR